MRILLVSPIPSHPQDQGNSARIHALGRLLQRAGAVVHFLYYPLEGLNPAQRAAMEADWDALHIVPVQRVNLAPQGAGHHRLDDWYDPRVGAAAAALHARHRYATVIANYVWCSAVLDAVPDTLKILDTHDVFGDRDRRFTAAGLAPAWFWTTPAEEARGLARADIVLAIQPEEAATLRAGGHPDVRVLGHLPPARARAMRQTGRPMIGYLASSNPINVASFLALQSAMARHPPPDAGLLIAGAICDRLTPATAAPFTLMGRIAHVDTFYDAVDLVVNPMTFGTGLKIKSVEAVFEGVPLVSTTAGMVGLPARHPLHQLPDPDAIAACLPDAIRDTARAELAAASRACAASYGAQVRTAAQSLWRVITDTPARTSPRSAPPRSPPPPPAAPGR